MTRVDAIIQRFLQMPRAVKWAVYTGVFLVAFLLWSDAIQPVTFEWRQTAERIERDLADVRNSDDVVAQFAGRKAKIILFGEVRVPLAEAEGAARLNAAVNEILKAHSVADDSFRTGSRQSLGLSLPGVTGPNERLEMLTSELRFECTPAEAAAIIAQLESHPDIEAVSSVRMTRLATDTVKVQLTLETWIIGQQRARR